MAVAVAMIDARPRLLELLRARSFERRRVVLASGRESDFFIDCKQTLLTAEGHALAAALFLAELDALQSADSPDRPRAVAGVELGGCPLASAVAMASFQRDPARALDALYVRKAVKDHGSRRQVEGDKSLAPGMAVALLEDVITTGGSTLRAIAELEAAGARVVVVACLVDRGEGGHDAITAAGYGVRAIYTRRDFVGDAR